MSNVGYDLDTSGGLMPLIRALIKPPDDEGNGQKAKKSQHPYYKRPGKGHNHDSCDACGEGGDLICCDRCPASFHLGCYDPPLDENDIPAGLWLCRECRASDAEQPSSSRGSRAVSPADSKSDTEKKTRSLRNSSNSKKRSRDDSDEEDNVKEVKKEPEPERELTPMEVLVKAARIMNPTQFELPKQMQIPCIFPGTEKEGTKNGTASVVTTDSWGCVPLPAKACYVCLGTCKQAPLLQCDYCPLLFHQDCLDPPLTALPTGRWMCPNHVEKYIDWKLVNSISMTERVALWDRFSAPVDQHAIKIDFIRRARKYKPMFRVKVPAVCRGRVRVPELVRRQYEDPPALLPSRREHVRCHNVLKRLKATGVYSESEDEDAPKHTICMNLSCPEYSGEGVCPYNKGHSTGDRGHPAGDRARSTRDRRHPAGDRRHSTGDRGHPAGYKDDKTRVGDKEETEDRIDDENEKTDRDNFKLEHASSSSDLSDSDFEYLTMSVKRRRRAPSPPSPPAVQLGEGGERLLAEVGEQLRNIDERLVRLLAWQRLQQVLSGEQSHGSFRWSSLSAAAERAVLRALPPARRPAPPHRPSELLSRADRERIATAVWGPAPPPPRAPPSPGHSLSGAPVRATLCPARTGGPSRPVAMRLSSVSVGAGACDVRLDAACRRVSPYHAVIFMDEVTRHFELINYSEYGTLVNGVMYACDVTAGETTARDVTDAPRDVTVTAARDVTAPAADAECALRDIVRHRIRRPHRVNGDVTSPRGGAGCACYTVGSGGAAGAWEGSALVPHGALLQFGCHQYVFSITDALTQPEPDV